MSPPTPATPLPMPIRYLIFALLDEASAETAGSAWLLGLKALLSILGCLALRAGFQRM